MTSIIVFVALFLISFITTWLVKRIAIKKAILDIPNERSSHSVPTPRGGGIAIVISIYIGLIWLFIQNLISQNLFYALLCGIILVIIGILDDIYNLSPKIRFIAQILSTSLALYFLGGLQSFNLGFTSIQAPLVLSIISVIGIVWFINLYNFIDGIDGYASAEAIFIGGAMYFITKSEIALILISTTLGFLPWNWQKAKIFMGDVGSTTLGFFLAILAIYFQNNNEFSLINWMILTSVFWFDATFTLFRRWKNKEKLSEAHKKHAYQRIVQAGFSHQKTVIYAIITNLILFSIILINIKSPKFLIPAFIIDLIFLFLITKSIDKKKPFK